MSQLNKIKVSGTEYDLVGLHQVVVSNVSNIPSSLTDNNYYIVSGEVSSDIDLSSALGATSAADCISKTQLGIMIQFKVASSVTTGVTITLPSYMTIYGSTSSQKVAYAGMTYCATMLLGQWHLALLQEQTTVSTLSLDEEEA